MRARWEVAAPWLSTGAPTRRRVGSRGRPAGASRHVQPPPPCEPATPVLTRPGRFENFAPPSRRRWISRCQSSSVVEQGTHKPLVGGSIPPSGTILRSQRSAERRMPSVAERMRSEGRARPASVLLGKTRPASALSQKARERCLDSDRGAGRGAHRPEMNPPGDGHRRHKRHKIPDSILVCILSLLWPSLPFSVSPCLCGSIHRSAAAAMA